MSAAILVSPTWQPTVLQLMPFSSNNASAAGHRSDATGRSKDFPTLAVTRSHDDWVAHLEASTKVQRATSERMPRSHYNQLTGRKHYSNRAQSEYKQREHHKPEPTLEKTCSVNDLNKKIISNASHQRESHNMPHSGTVGTVSLSEIHGTSAHLQNPTFKRAWDGHYYLPQNGFWRSMTFTPGELDLQKHRDIMNKEQGKRTNKVKLNINQLPRSNTPINDNDPDKLNMHHVIEFLRTHNDGNDDAQAKPVEKCKTEKDKEYFLKKRGCASASVEISSRHPGKGFQSKTTDVSVPRSALDVANTSTRSSTLIRGRINKHTKGGHTEWKPVWDGGSEVMSNGSNKPFRLHRFLKMTPTCAESNNTINKAYMHDPSHILKTLEINDQIQLPKTRYDLHRFDPSSIQHKGIPATSIERHYRLAYRLPANRPSVKPIYKNDGNRNADGSVSDCNHVASDGAIIRLPSMHDFKTDSENGSECGDSRSTHVQREACCACHSNQSTGSIKGTVQSSKETRGADSFQSLAEVKASPKRLQVSVPCESHVADVNVTKHTLDCVKLSLRQERGLTREHTYMSDLGNSKSDLMDERDSVESPNRKPSPSHSVENKMEKEDRSSRNS